MGKKAHRVYSIESEYMEQYAMQRERAERRKKNLMIRLTTAGIIMLLLTVVVAYYHIGQRAVYAEKQEQYEALQAEMDYLNKEENELREEIGLLNDESYILNIARTNYFLSKEGELIFQLEDYSSSY